MSDEYASSGYKGSLVNDSSEPQTTDNYSTSNYPPENDTTSSGGYGSGTSSWSTAAQRGRTDVERESAPSLDSSEDIDEGLVQQSTSGGDLSSQTQDAKQGRDMGLSGVGGGPLNLYNESLETREDAERKLAGAYGSSP